MKIINPDATKVITCPFDEDEPKAEFEILVTLPAEERSQLQDSLMQLLKAHPPEKVSVEADSQLGLKALEAGVQVGEDGKVSVSLPTVPLLGYYSWFEKIVEVGLRGIRYSDRTAWKSPNCKVPKETLRALSMQRLPNASGFDNLINWLGARIWEENRWTDEEKKTSSEPSESGSI